MGIDELEDQIADHRSQLDNLLQSPHAATPSLSQRLENWREKLKLSAENLHLWRIVQQLWISLETVFHGGHTGTELHRILPREYNKFKSVQKLWRSIGKKI